MQNIPQELKDPLLDVFHVDGASEYFLDLQTRKRTTRHKQHTKGNHVRI